MSAFVRNFVFSIIKFIYCSFQRSRSSTFYAQASTCAGYRETRNDASALRVWINRATPPFQREPDFPTISIVPVISRLTCMRARFKYKPVYDGGNSTSSCCHKAVACRVHGYRVQLVRSLSLSLSFSLCFSPLLIFPFLSLTLLFGAGLTELYGQSHGIVDWLDPMIDGALA